MFAPTDAVGYEVAAAPEIRADIALQPL